MGDGKYSKSGDDLTSRIFRAPKGLNVSVTRRTLEKGEKEEDVSQKYNGGIFYISPRMASLIASLFVFLLVSTCYVAVSFLTRERQLKLYKEQQEKMQIEIEELQKKNLEYERRFVTLSTAIENLKENGD